MNYRFHGTNNFLRLAAIALLGSSALPAFAQTAGLTYDRLLNADKETQNWLTYNRTYNGQRFSPLNEINRDTVKNLHLAFALALTPPMGTMSTYKFAGLEGTPIVIVRIEKAKAEYGLMPLINIWWPQTQNPRKPIPHTAPTIAR